MIQKARGAERSQQAEDPVLAHRGVNRGRHPSLTSHVPCPSGPPQKSSSLSVEQRAEQLSSVYNRHCSSSAREEAELQVLPFPATAQSTLGEKHSRERRRF